MTRVQQLAGFHQHFDDMLVAMPSGTPPRMSVEEKDVHGTLVSVVGMVSSRVKHEALFKSFITTETYVPTNAPCASNEDLGIPNETTGGLTHGERLFEAFCNGSSIRNFAKCFRTGDPCESSPHVSFGLPKSSFEEV